MVVRVQLKLKECPSATPYHLTSGTQVNILKAIKKLRLPRSSASPTNRYALVTITKRVVPRTVWVKSLQRLSFSTSGSASVLGDVPLKKSTIKKITALILKVRIFSTRLFTKRKVKCSKLKSILIIKWHLDKETQKWKKILVKTHKKYQSRI